MHNQGRHYIARGRTLILIGHAGHPEVEGTLGQIDGPTYLVQNEAEIAALPLADDTPVAYITQTTLSVDDTSALIEALKRRFTDVVGPGDARHLLRHAEPPERGARSRPRRRSDPRRRREKQLQFQPLARDCRRIRRAGLSCRRRQPGGPRHGSKVLRWSGLTAGASAPEVLVEDVIDALRRIAPVEVSTLDGIEENVRFRLPLELEDNVNARANRAARGR